MDPEILHSGQLFSIGVLYIERIFSFIMYFSCQTQVLPSPLAGQELHIENIFHHKIPIFTRESDIEDDDGKICHPTLAVLIQSEKLCRNKSLIPITEQCDNQKFFFHTFICPCSCAMSIFHFGSVFIFMN